MRKSVVSNVFRFPIVTSGLIPFSLRIEQRLIRRPGRISPSENNKSGECEDDEKSEGSKGEKRTPGGKNDQAPDRCFDELPREDCEQERESQEAQPARERKRPQAPVASEGKQRPMP